MPPGTIFLEDPSLTAVVILRGLKLQEEEVKNSNLTKKCLQSLKALNKGKRSPIYKFERMEIYPNTQNFQLLPKRVGLCCSN